MESFKKSETHINMAKNIIDHIFFLFSFVTEVVFPNFCKCSTLPKRIPLVYHLPPFRMQIICISSMISDQEFHHHVFYVIFSKFFFFRIFLHGRHIRLILNSNYAIDANPDKNSLYKMGYQKTRFIHKLFNRARAQYSKCI